MQGPSWRFTILVNTLWPRLHVIQYVLITPSYNGEIVTLRLHSLGSLGYFNKGESLIENDVLRVTGVSG
jgi:hypothetical protein